MYEEKKEDEIGCCEIPIFFGAVRSASSPTCLQSYSSSYISEGNHKENATEISYLLSENIFGLVEIVAEVKDKLFLKHDKVRKYLTKQQC